MTIEDETKALSYE